MRIVWGLAAAAAVLTACAARAEEPAGAPVVGVGVICNTSGQAAQFVSLLREGRDVTPAVAQVNEQAQEPHACGVAAVAFVPDQTVATETFGGRLLRIMRVTVVAGYSESGWHDVGRAVQYAIVEGGGETI